MRNGMRILFGLTGASGHPVAVDLIRRCPAGEKFLVASAWGRNVLRTETGLDLEELRPHVKEILRDDDLGAPFASGTVPLDACVIAPCSTSTLGRISAGIGDTLITRAAQVALKERRPLILGVREAPLSAVVLEAALRLARAGATIVPFSPPFYTGPRTLEDAVTDMSDRIMRSLGFDVGKRWNPNTSKVQRPRSKGRAKPPRNIRGRR